MTEKKPEKLAVTLVQTPLHWENKQENLTMFDELLDGIEGKTDLIVLPEMFTTGFTMNTRELAETTPGRTVEWMLMKASDTGAAVAGSMIAREKGKYYNRMIWAHPDGEWEKYDKRHLFTMAGEDRYFTAGNQRVVIRFKGWKILPLVCYDLRFPVWSRNKNDDKGQAEFDMLIYMANWPEARRMAWKKLLLARAIENQVFVAGVNRTGIDGKNIPYSGDSSLINPYGEYETEVIPGEQHVVTHRIDYDVLSAFREKFPVLNDADDFELKS